MTALDPWLSVTSTNVTRVPKSRNDVESLGLYLNVEERQGSKVAQVENYLLGPVVFNICQAQNLSPENVCLIVLT